MKIASLRIRSLEIPFRSAFRHASAERAATQTLWVEAVSAHGKVGYGESCPREYVTGESLAGGASFFRRYESAWLRSIDGLDALRSWVADHTQEIDRNPAAWCAVELALLDLIGQSTQESIEKLLGLRGIEGRFRYTAVLGDAGASQFGAQLEHYREAGFRDFKIKLSGHLERDGAKVRALTAAGIEARAVRADANNLWPDADAALAHLQALSYPFGAIEEPLKAGDYGGMARIAAALDARIVLDESFLARGQLDRLDAGPWIVNLRVSKMGGLLRSLALLPALRSRGFALIVGAQVGETSVLTRAALTVAVAGRDILVGQEGAFGTHLLAHDVVDLPLMFGPGGELQADAGRFAGPGLGLTMRVAPDDLREIEAAG